jgi:methylglyoxal synthase
MQRNADVKGRMKKLTLALTAHDSKKENMIDLVKAHQDELTEINLVAAKDVGEIIKAKTALPVALLNDDGDEQIGALVANGDIRGVIFLRDLMVARPQELDIIALLRICDVHGVPVATNLAAGEAVIHLMAEHPAALRVHHIIAQYLEDIASVHE